jgi:DNA mismatch endonuclease (patch repair protein)
VADIFDPSKRSDIMRRIKSKNSKAELLVFAYLRRHKVYHQKHYQRAPGRPDVALPRKKLAVFIDGDFWNGRTLEALIIRRKDPEDYWVKKIKGNMLRDQKQAVQLAEMGWKIFRVWESDLNRKRTSLETLEKIRSFLQERPNGR